MLQIKLTYNRRAFSVVHCQLERVCVTPEEDRVPAVVVHWWPGTRRRSDDLRQNVGEHQQQLRGHVTPPNQHCYKRHVLLTCSGKSRRVMNAAPNTECTKRIQPDLLYSYRVNITFCGCRPIKESVSQQYTQLCTNTRTTVSNLAVGNEQWNSTAALIRHRYAKRRLIA